MELLNYPGYRYCYYVLKYFLRCHYFPKMISLKYHEPYYHYVHFLHCYYKKSCYVYYLDVYRLNVLTKLHLCGLTFPDVHRKNGFALPDG